MVLVTKWNLTADLLPKQLEVLRFRPGEVLRLRIQRTLRSILCVVIAAPFYIFFLGFAFSYVGGFLGYEEDTARFAGVFVGSILFFYSAFHFKEVVEINFVKGTTSFITPCSFSKTPVKPEIKLLQDAKTGVEQWCLYINDALIASTGRDDEARASHTTFSRFIEKLELDLACAEFTTPSEVKFKWFADTKSADENPEPEDIPSLETVTTTQTVQSDIRPRGVPLVYLVHVTWAPHSPWTLLESSELVAGLRQVFRGDIEIRRLQWSGANRPSARKAGADKLRGEVTRALEEANREVFLIGHSHGGNVVVSSFRDLTEEHQQQTHCILLATPFLVKKRSVDLDEVYQSLPKFLQNNLHSFCMFGFWALVNYFGPLNPMNNSALNGIMGLASIFLWVWGPAFLFHYLWQKISAYIEKIDANTDANLLSAAGRNRHNFQVLTSPHDEVFQILSIFTSLMSLGHQLLFLVLI